MLFSTSPNFVPTRKIPQHCSGAKGACSFRRRPTLFHPCSILVPTRKTPQLREACSFQKPSFCLRVFLRTLISYGYPPRKRAFLATTKKCFEPRFSLRRSKHLLPVSNRYNHHLVDWEFPSLLIATLKPPIRSIDCRVSGRSI